MDDPIKREHAAFVEWLGNHLRSDIEGVNSTRLEDDDLQNRKELLFTAYGAGSVSEWMRSSPNIKSLVAERLRQMQQENRCHCNECQATVVLDLVADVIGRIYT